MATGFCPALLLDINDVAGQNAPDRKMHIMGFLSMLLCCQNSLANPLQDGLRGGHRRTMTVKYSPRPLVSTVQSEDDCDINARPSYSEWTVPSLSHKQVSFFIEDDTVRQYCQDASQMQTLGRTQVMQEVYYRFIQYANVLAKAVNQDLLAQQATEFGENATNGDDGGTLINISTNTDSFNLSNGIIQMLQDIQNNEICSDVCLVGSGLFANYTQAQALMCCNQAGLNMGAAGLPRFFFDKDAGSIWGTNSVGLFAQGSVKFLSWDKYVGNWAGKRGDSDFFNVAFPVNAFGCNADDCVSDFGIDVQIRYIDCPGSYTVNGTPTSLGRGWQVILSKDYAYWVQPTTGYQSSDDLADTNGTIKYFFSNTSYTGGSYSLY